MTVTVAPPLTVVREARFADVLADAFAGPVPGRLEASGVVRAEGRLWVVFDNLPVVACLSPELDTPDPTARLVPLPADLTGLEDITHDPVRGRFYVVVEGRSSGPGPPRALVAEFDQDWRELGRRWVDIPLAKANKGLEGLDLVRRDGQTHLLGLLEGNRGLAGKAGRRPGGGRVHVLAEDDARWHSIATIHLPRSLPFEDYSAISVVDDRVAVLSQESSAVWIGRLDPTAWDIMGDGVVHPFPLDASGRSRYRTTEGVAWLTERELAVVSDRETKALATAKQDKAQSVHVVELPARL
ncbi:MAG: hypothetical protein ACOYBY_04520 [Dermatophilaceae bacterium]